MVKHSKTYWFICLRTHSIIQYQLWNILQVNGFFIWISHIEVQKDHFYVIINDLYAIVFYYYSMTSIYIPHFSFVFYITILYNSDLYSIFSYLYLIFVHVYSIVLIYILYFHVSII